MFEVWRRTGILPVPQARSLRYGRPNLTVVCGGNFGKLSYRDKLTYRSTSARDWKIML